MSESTSAVVVLSHDESPNISTSQQVKLVKRPHTNMRVQVVVEVEADISIYTAELATALKSEFANKGGVTLDKAEVYVTGYTKGSQFVVAIHTAGESCSNFTSVFTKLGSKQHAVHGANMSIREEYEIAIPAGVGTQLVPPDPAHPAMHISFATRKSFKGFLQFFFTYSCDRYYNEIQGFQKAAA